MDSDVAVHSVGEGLDQIVERDENQRAASE
jgi:hypothetical protein